MQIKAYVQSYTGRKISLFDLTPEDVCLDDVAHALANKCRFNGHCAVFYSVAQHCVLGAQALQSIDATACLSFLMHDVSETYLPDVASPLKRHLKVIDSDNQPISWDILEARHRRVITKALGCPDVDCCSRSVITMDSEMLLAERDALLSKPSFDWGVDGFSAPVVIQPWSPEEAEENFRNAFTKYFKRSSDVL